MGEATRTKRARNRNIFYLYTNSDSKYYVHF